MRSRPASAIRLALVLSASLLPAVVTADPPTLPDLVVDVLTVPAPEQSITPAGLAIPTPRQVRIGIANEGAPSPSGAVVALYEILPDGRRATRQTFFSAPLAAGARVEYTTTWTPAPDVVGDADLVAVVDPSNVIVESDDLDNARHARTATRIGTSALSPMRAVSRPLEAPVMIGGEWAAYGFEANERANPMTGLLLDRSANGRDMRMPPTAPVEKFGVTGLGARFVGNEVYSVAWTGAPAGPVPAAAVSVWMRVDERPAFPETVWSVPAGECYRVSLEVRPDGRMRLLAPTLEGGCVNYVDLGPVTLDQWTHVVVAWTGEEAVVYANARPLGAPVDSAPPTSPVGKLYVGAHNSGGVAQTATAFLEAVALDELRLYDRAIGPADVAALYALGAS